MVKIIFKDLREIQTHEVHERIFMVEFVMHRNDEIESTDILNFTTRIDETTLNTIKGTFKTDDGGIRKVIYGIVKEKVTTDVKINSKISNTEFKFYRDEYLAYKHKIASYLASTSLPDDVYPEIVEVECKRKMGF